MPTFSEIPLTNRPQQFKITLSGVDYWLTTTYADGSGWLLDIADPQKNPIISGTPLVTGVDLLAQYAYLNFGGRLWVQTLNDPDAVPTFDNLGDAAKLLWVTT